MTRPAVTASTDRLYAGLPEVYRDADEALDYPLLRYLSLLGDQLGAVEDLLDRLLLTEGHTTSDLVDPDTADPRWLGWLAQLVGVVIPGGTATADARALVRGAPSGWRSGTRASIAAAAGTVLTGTRTVDVHPHLGGDPLVIGVSTLEEETPADVTRVEAAVDTGRARPAGHVIRHSYYFAAWDLLEARYPTWDQLELNAGSWTRLQATRP